MITEEDFLDFACPYCGVSISFPLQQRSSLQQCPMCSESVMVPDTAGAPGRKIGVPFSTQRLTLRRLTTADWKDLLEFLANEESFRYTTGQPLDEAAVLRWLESDAHVKLTTPDHPFYLGVTLREGGKLIGYASLVLSSPEPVQSGVTLFVNPAYQKQGYGTEAFQGVVNFCFTDLNLHRIMASCDGRNEAAARLLERVGMRREGECLKDTLHHGEWTNTLMYAALREEFEAMRGGAKGS